MCLSSLRIAAAELVLDRQETEALIRVADEALCQGVYSYSLGELATVPSLRYEDACQWFLRAMKELAMPVPTNKAAARFLARQHISSIATRTILPYEGLCRLASFFYMRAELQLNNFNGL